MNKPISIDVNNDDYQGQVSSRYFSDELVNQLRSIKETLSAKDKLKLSTGKDYVIKCQLKFKEDYQWVAIKVFGPQPFWKDIYDKKHKSKAERSYAAAEYLVLHEIGTPDPVAWIDKWQNKKLVESYYICKYEPGICVRDLMSEILWYKRNNEPLMQLIELLAPAVKKMHDAGFMHGDMGNQNILISQDEQGNFLAPQWIDLNRSQIFNRPLKAKERAFDLSRLIMPSGYFQWFKYIYSNHKIVDAELEKYETLYRKSFTRHRRNSKFRHPIRYLKRKKLESKPFYPDEKDVWLWDEKSGQPMITMTKKNKNQHREWWFLINSIWKTLISFPGIWSHYKALQKISFQQPVDLKSRIGVALNPKPEYMQQEIALHHQLGQPPVLIRFYHHETLDDWQRSMELINQLKNQDVKIMAAIIQDRQAVKEPESWKRFLNTVIPSIATAVEFIEITHAYNRVKWGIWNHKELIQLMQPAFDLQKQFPQIKLTGPACIDFEYAPVISALKSLPAFFYFSALSHLLYVDRRGAPENRQGKFSTLEKVTLLKALAKHSRNCDDKVIISEVNWPVKYTGIWSPVICPYITPKWRRLEPGETEDVYAHFMLRYLAITICSGHVDQVFWWRLSAHGYGLIDDQDNFRERPAFTALKFFLELLGDARFEKKLVSDKDTYLLEFLSGDKCYLMAWTITQTKSFTDINFNMAWDYLGRPVNTVELSSAPVYLLLE